MHTAKDLGLAIAHLRGERTQAEVARRAGIDPATWSLYEAGKRMPREQSRRRILRGLRCSELELEETVWRMRRQRLVYEQRAKGEEAAIARPLSQVVEPASTSSSWHADFRRRELRALVTRYSAALEELLAFVLRAED